MRQRESQGKELHVQILRVFTENAQNLPLDADAGSGGVDGRHFGVGGLETNHTALAVKTLEGSVGAVNEGDYDLAFPGGTCALDQNVVAGDDVLVAHGVAAYFEGEDLAIANDVGEGDALCGFDGFYGLASGDSAHERQAIGALFATAGRKDIDGAAAVVRTLKEALVLQIRDVFVHGGERTEAQTAGNLLVGGGVAVFLGKAGEEVQHLFLPSRDCHADDCSE